MKDDCVTAEDVRRKIRKVAQFRKRMFPKPPPVKPPKPPPPPPEKTQVQIHGVKIVAHVDSTPIDDTITIRTIVRAVADDLGIARMSVFKRARTPSFVNTRHLIWIIIRILLPQKSLPEIGRSFMCDHTTILYALEKYPNTVRELKQLEADMTLEYMIKYTRALMRDEAKLRGRRYVVFPVAG